MARLDTPSLARMILGSPRLSSLTLEEKLSDPRKTADRLTDLIRDLERSRRHSGLLSFQLQLKHIGLSPGFLSCSPPPQDFIEFEDDVPTLLGRLTDLSKLQSFDCLNSDGGSQFNLTKMPFDCRPLLEATNLRKLTVGTVTPEIVMLVRQLTACSRKLYEIKLSDQVYAPQSWHAPLSDLGIGWKKIYCLPELSLSIAKDYDKVIGPLFGSPEMIEELSMFHAHLVRSFQYLADLI